MFEGAVSQVLAGYLGRYVKGIQKDQLKIGLWNEEILLENVELMLEAFDYLQLPFALKNGQIGKLSIRIPWKRFGREPIVIVIEDVFICACDRKDDEWRSDLVKGRELAGKMAKLNAIELAKLSRRVSDNQGGQSLMSYISTKILDSIQISMRNVHIVFIDTHNEQGLFIFGLKLSTLTVMTDVSKHNSTLSSVGKLKGGRVSKIIEISSVGLYCNKLVASQELPDISAIADSQKYFQTSSDFENFDFFLHPFDVKISLLANKSGKIGNALQYVVDINTTTLVISLSEIQLHRILSVLDYFSVCSLRERYGRFRPMQISLSKRHNGWQRLWWQYAQNAILADVRKKLWKNSWSYLGKRIIQRRTYVQLYRKKLELIQQEQVVSKDILLELEEMDREYDLEDILSYRSLAEQKMQELSNANNLSKRIDCETSPSATHEKQQNDDRSSSSVRGWLNWLSLGMLGAGGTADSSSFAGVISEEIIKDIYEATEFNLVGAVSEDSLRTENLLSSSIKLNICQIVATITNKHEKKIILATLDGISAECQFRENSSTIHALIHLVNIINPSNHKVVLFPKKDMLDDSLSHRSLPFVDFHFSQQFSDQIFEPLIKVVLQPFEATYDLEYFLEIWELCEGFLSFQFLHKRVLLSLNRLADFKSRLFIKAEYISQYRKRMGWDIFLNNFVIKFPLSYEDACSSTMLFQLEGLSFKSMPNIEKLPALLERCPFENYDLTCCLRYIMDNGLSGFQLQYFYDQFELSLAGLQVKLLMPNPEMAICMVEKCSPIFTFIRCIFIEESFLRPFEVSCLLPVLNLRFCPTILSLIKRLVIFPEGKSISLTRSVPIENMFDKLSGLSSSYFSLSFKLDYLNIHVALEDDTDCDTAVYFDFEKIDSWYVTGETVELSCLFEKVVIITRDLRHEHDNLMLCSASCSAKSPDIYVEHDSKSQTGVTYGKRCSHYYCFQLHYRTSFRDNAVYHEYHIFLSEVDLHIYPRIFGLLQRLFNRIDVQSFSSSACNESCVEVDQNDELWKRAIFDCSAFGFSNFCTVDTSVAASISVDHFPFVTIYDSGSFSNLENSVVNGGSGSQNLCVIEKHHPRRIKLSKKREFSQDYSVLNTLKLSKFYDIISLDINLNASKAHFHDCSCVLGTISLPEFQCIISFHGNDKWDVLVSADGLSVFSPFSPYEVIWGSVSSALSPVLNVRARKSEKQEMLNVSFGFQHVKCILTSEFLAMLIGYFSLPDWSLKGTMKADELWTSSNDEFYGSSGFETQIIYKFEILESIIIFPVEDHFAFCLQVDAPRLYCSFILASTSENVFNDISFECNVPSITVASGFNIFNLFGRSLSLSLLPLKDATSLFKLGYNIHLVEHLDTDVWLRVPCKIKKSVDDADFPALIMINVDNCKMTVEDEYFFDGVGATISVVDQLSLVNEVSEYFTSDVLHFLHLKRKINVEAVRIPDRPNEFSIILKAHAKALSFNFCRSNVKGASMVETLANLYVRLDCSAAVRNGLLKSLDAEVSSFLLHSFCNDLLLASFTSDDAATFHIGINFCRSLQGNAEIEFAIPAFDIWLHMPEWVSIKAFLCSLKGKLDILFPSSVMSLKSSYKDNSECSVSSCSASESTMQEIEIFTLKSENIIISFHVPLYDNEQDSSKFDVYKADQYNVLGTAAAVSQSALKSSKQVKLLFQSKYFLFTIEENHMKLKFNIDKMRTFLEMVQGHERYSLPFIYISHVKIETEVHYGEQLIQALLDVQVESADVGFSYPIFKFLSQVRFRAYEQGVSKIQPCCMFLKFKLTKGALLLSDGRWGFHAPILEILIKCMDIQLKQTNNIFDGSGYIDLLINYNNVDKVMWEPFVEPWNFRFSFIRRAGNILLDTNKTMEVCMESTNQLNLNITEPLIEAIFRFQDMVSHAFNHNAEVLKSIDIALPVNDEINSRRYAPYILRNDTSLPLVYYVSRGSMNAQEKQSLVNGDGKFVQPGFSVPIYIEETVDELLFRHRKACSSELLIEKKLSATLHNMISIHLDGTSGPSKPMSMDLVGLSFFEVNFSNNKYISKIEERKATDQGKGVVVPVVFEVSMLHYCKMIRLYSTVILLNSTSVPLEVRFDIPFGISPKILDPLFPGQELALPLHLAETGHIRFHPVGTNYLWSEAQSLPNILLHENRPGLLRSFVCYPTQPSSDPFRCCISVEDYSLSSFGAARKCPSLIHNVTEISKFKNIVKGVFNVAQERKHHIQHMKIITPFSVKNCLPISLSLVVESCGFTHSIVIAKGNSASCFAVDSTHDLEVTCRIEGYKPVVSKFPRTETFSEIAKFSGSKYFLHERIYFYSCVSSGLLCVNLEKVLHQSCSAREIILYSSYLLYNCTGLSLAIVDRNHEHKGIAHIISPSYQILEQEQVKDEKQGLASLTYQFKSFQRFLSMEEKAKQSSYLFLNSSMDGDRDKYAEYPSGKAGNSVERTVHSLSKEAKPYMYDPVDHIPASELLVSLAASANLIRDENVHRMTWSAPFPLAPNSGSTNVTIPKSNATGAFLISANLITAMGELSGRTKAIAFQPRYIICNACNNDLCFKQKGTNISSYLPVGKHCHLHLSDASRELLVSLRFNDRGWQWSGCFLPDCLGDVQLKMRNYISGELNMIRVEVQNADLALRDGKLVPTSDGSYSTQLILLSEDKTGFMPYRIDNFSMERLRIYQQRCESMETIVHPYTSSKYAWDEPCYAHRIIVEVPGEQILGTYNLDNIQEDAPVYLPSTSEKPERKLFISVHADGAMKVLSIIDSSYHIVRDTVGSNFEGLKEKRKPEPEANFSEVIKFHFPFVGISLMSSNPQELIFICVRGATTILMQSSEKQKFLSQILSLQIDNQLPDTPYPIVVSFDNDSKGRYMDTSKYKDNFLHNQHDDMSSSIIGVPVFYFSASKWRRPDVLLVSFEYITLRLAPLCFELDEQFILCLLEFSRNVYSRLQRTSVKSFHQDLVYCNEGSYKITWYQSSTSVQHATKLLPSVATMGAPWQPIYLLAKRQNKIYIGVLELAPINISVSFSSTPWMVRNEVFVEVEKLTYFSGTAFQRGIMALVDVEGVPIHFGQLSMQHLMASPRSLHDILVRHYMRQLLHGIYKLFGSVGVIGNPLGFARNVGLGIKDFISVSSRSVVQSPFGILTGVAEGSKSLFSNTIYALSSATTQFSKSAHKWIVAFTFNEQTVANHDMLLRTTNLHDKGVLNEFLEGLTGFLQSPIRGAEKHGLPGVLSGVAMGTIGLVARPVASLLEGTAKTAQSIRNRSSPHLSNRRRVRLPRPLARELPLLPYSWEDAIGLTMLQQADRAKYKDEIYVICKSLKQAGKFIVISEKHVLVVYCSCLVGLGLLDFAGVPANLTWVIETEMKLESVVLVDRTDDSVNVVGSNAEVACTHKKVGSRHKTWGPPISAPFIYLSVEFPSALEAENVLQVLLSTIQIEREKRCGLQVLHRANLTKASSC